MSNTVLVIGKIASEIWSHKTISSGQSKSGGHCTQGRKSRICANRMEFDLTQALICSGAARGRVCFRLRNWRSSIGVSYKYLCVKDKIVKKVQLLRTWMDSPVQDYPGSSPQLPSARAKVLKGIFMTAHTKES